MSFHRKHCLKLKSVHKLGFAVSLKIYYGDLVIWLEENSIPKCTAFLLTFVELSPREEIAVLVPSLNIIPNFVKTFHVFINYMLPNMSCLL